ncbi:MAG: hypothetical protein ACK45U_02690 [bacterium]|jgi:hypothetical protein
MLHRVIIIFIVSVFYLSSCSNSSEKKLDNKTDSLTTDTILPSVVTYNEHIANIIYTKCATCHRPGESGPFPLLSYKDVYRRKKTIVKVTHSGYMPPWPADRTYSSFVGELYLTSYEKALIKKWVDDGVNEGSSEFKKPIPDFPKGSQIGKPDLVIRFPKDFTIEGNNKDHYVIMKIPYEIPSDKYVKLIEFVPGNRKRVHHVNGYMVVYDAGKKKSLHNGQYFVNNYETDIKTVWKKLDILNDDGSYPLRIPSATNYLPGVVPAVYPEGVGGFLMKKQGAILLNDIHYGPTSKDEFDNSYFNVFYSDVAPKRRFGEFQLGTYGVSEIKPKLMVPPDSIKTFTTQYTVQEDISLVTINPHMHLLGKTFIAYVISTDGNIIPLIRINNWDFRWQYFYTFKKMLKITKGSTIHVRATFDNTQNNPFNPYKPARWIGERKGSMSTKDEMLQFIVTYLPYQQGDENISLENYK